MADFTEEYLRRMTDIENQKVAQLTGIKNVLGGEGAGVPAVTEADNGKVLKVVNGAWAAAAAGGVLILETVQEESNVRTNKTAGEVKEAFYAGRPICLASNGAFAYCTGYEEDTGNLYKVSFRIDDTLSFTFTATSEDDYMTLPQDESPNY